MIVSLMRDLWVLRVTGRREEVDRVNRVDKGDRGSNHEELPCQSVNY
jgi:hypothetical protein